MHTQYVLFMQDLVRAERDARQRHTHDGVVVRRRRRRPRPRAVT